MILTARREWYEFHIGLAFTAEVPVYTDAVSWIVIVAAPSACESGETLFARLHESTCATMILVSVLRYSNRSANLRIRPRR